MKTSNIRKLREELERTKKEGSMTRDIITKSPNYITGKVETTKIRSGKKIERDIRNALRTVKAQKKFEKRFDKTISGTEKFISGALRLSRPKVKIGYSPEGLLKDYSRFYQKAKTGDTSQINLFKAKW